MNLYDITVQNNQGESVSLSQYQGKVLLIVNTATKCGFTPQYEALETLYEAHRDEGFEILDFPCNQFAFQAPGDDEKIDTFCKLRFDTKFPRFAKIKVNGSGESELYTYLKSVYSGRIKWNFTKFLVSRDGTVVARYGSAVKPEEIEDAIRAELAK